MSWLLGIIAAAFGIIAAMWAAFRAGSRDQRAQVVETLAAAIERDKARKTEADAAIERDRVAAIATAQSGTEVRRNEAKHDIVAAEKRMQRETDDPWEP